MEIATDCEHKIIKHHLHVMKTSLVYDVHSNNWEDDRKFHEGERCSFPMQMWNFYVRSLVHDISGHLPPKTARRIISEIGTEMLIFFEARYSFLKVACRRRNQFKADIIVLLSVYKWLLLYVAESPNMYLGQKDSTYELWHVMCNELLHLVVIVCSPLSCAIKYYSNAPGEECDRPTDWLCDLGEEHFCESKNLMFELLVKQPVLNQALLEKFLCLEDGFVPVLLLQNIKLLKEELPAENSRSLLNGALSEPVPTKSEPLDEDTLLKSMYYILMRLPSRRPFMKFMSKLMEEDRSKSFKITCTDRLPKWLLLITDNVKTTLRHALHPVLELLVHSDLVDSTPQFVFTNVQTLPCGCHTQPIVDEKKFSRNALLLHKCLMMTLDGLVDNIACIPSIIWHVFPFIKKDPNVTSSWTTQTQLGTKILACLLFNWLCDRDNLAFFAIRCHISDATYRTISDFGELLWHVVYNLTHNVTENRSISMDINKDMQKSADAVKSRLDIIAAACNMESCETREDFTVEIDGPNCDPNVQLQSAEGVEALTYMGRVVKQNEMLLRELLANPTYHKISGETRLSLQQDVCSGFDPLHEFQTICHTRLDHFQLLEGELEWGGLMAGIGRDRVDAFIGHRFEFQDQFASVLTEDELRDVAELKSLMEQKN